MSTTFQSHAVAYEDTDIKYDDDVAEKGGVQPYAVTDAKHCAYRLWPLSVFCLIRLGVIDFDERDFDKVQRRLQQRHVQM
jgi:hypothetical protein